MDSNTDRSSDPVPMPAPSELAEHSTSVGHNFRHFKLEPSEHPVLGGAPRGMVRFSYNQSVSETTGQSKTGKDVVLKPAPSETTEPPERERDYCRKQAQCPVHCRPGCQKSSQSHNSQKTYHGWVDRTSRNPDRSGERLL